MSLLPVQESLHLVVFYSHKLIACSILSSIFAFTQMQHPGNTCVWSHFITKMMGVFKTYQGQASKPLENVSSKSHKRLKIDGMFMTFNTSASTKFLARNLKCKPKPSSFLTKIIQSMCPTTTYTTLTGFSEKLLNTICFIDSLYIMG